MAFKNLEERFNENVDKLYAGAKTKFENGKPSTGKNDDPLIVRKPGDGYWNFVESRSTPITSAVTDVKRLTLFTASSRGIKFLAKQQILQTGNTFESTRIINPAFHLSNAVPFLHTKRALDVPITARGVARSILGNNELTRQVFGSGELKRGSVSSSDRGDLKKVGQLQQETYNKFVSSSPTAKSFVSKFIKKIPVIGQTVSAVSAKRSMGDVGDGYTNSRPELGNSASDYIVYLYANGESARRQQTSESLTASAINAIKKLFNKKNSSSQPNISSSPTEYYKYGPLNKNGKYITYLKITNDKDKWKSLDLGVIDYKRYTPNKMDRISDKEYRSNLISDTGKKDNINSKIKDADSTKDLDANISKFQKSNDEFIIDVTHLSSTKDETQPFIKYFKSDGIKDRKTTNIRDLAKDAAGKPKKISYIKDASNEKVSEPNFKVSKRAYQLIQTKFDDPIVVSFAMGNDDPIRFRAFIKDLQQSANPEYKQYQYIGRMEKFINYIGVQREISFKIGVIAFSKDEVEGVWRRINYLTGLVFPYGFNRGIFQPNITRLTIGDVYVNQPGYVSSLSTNFNEFGESWELDRGQQVPISAVMDIKFVLIEKSSKIADSPFYGITDGGTSGTPMRGFYSTIPTSQNPELESLKAPPSTKQPVITTVQERKPPAPINPNPSIVNRSGEAFRNVVRPTGTP